MFWQKLPGRLAAIAIVISTPLVLFLANLHFLASPLFIQAQYAKPGFPSAPGFTDAQRLSYATATLEYLRSGQSIQALQKLEHDGQPLYNVRELIHMADVKAVMYWAFVVFWVALAILLIAAIYVLFSPDLGHKLPVYIFDGCLVLGVIMAAIAGWALVRFDTFFVFFHRVFFVGDSWLFESTDSLIRLFPLEFWVDAALIWIVMAFAEIVLIGAAAYLWPGWKHRR